MIYRIDVGTAKSARDGQSGDAVGESIRQQIAEWGVKVGPITTRRIFLLDTDASAQEVNQIATDLLADPIVESAQVVREAPHDNGHSRIEVHLKPGVMDPLAASTEMAIRDMGLDVKEVRTGRSYLISGKLAREELERIASRVLANGVVESVHFQPFIPREFPRGHAYEFKLRRVEILKLSDEQLVKLSREGHLFLSLAEMKAIQNYFQKQNREPTDIELETLAQTWSEHCVHKTLKSSVDLEIKDESGKTIATRHYDNLIRDTIFKSTMDLMKAGKSDFCLSVFADNAGVIAFDETDAVCFKVETHNHPSAIEPYGGSATGVGGVIRDVLGTGLAARPIANTDVFCVAFPNFDSSKLPKGVIHPKRVLQQVVSGVRDYGNRMGIPTVNGAVYFDDKYLGNPLVFCGCVGLIPKDKIAKEVRDGDAIVVMGGRTGRDGIHGATFSSAELTDSHADEFSHAVQIGNAITEKKMADVILQARDRDLFTAITDCGAGGLSSAIGEMGEKTGAVVHLDKVPLKYAGLRYDEIWISEAQERMVLSVPENKVREVLSLASSEDVEATVIGFFGARNWTEADERTNKPHLLLHYHDQKVGMLSMEFLHKGIPTPHRKAVYQPKPALQTTNNKPQTNLRDRLLATLSHPNIASKHWIIRQYDHEVQGGSVIKPLTGPQQIGPSDASVLRPKLNSYRGIALGIGLAPHIKDPYDMTIAAIDEAIRNVVAVGADPNQIAILDNFCWPSVDDEKTMGDLARTCEACHDAAKAYGIPFISGKDSLHNQFTNQETKEVIRIPNTLLISAIGVIDDVRKCVTMDLKKPGNTFCLIRPRSPGLAGLVSVHHFIAECIDKSLILSCHDVSDGGLITAAAEMCIASGKGLNLDLSVGFIDPLREVSGQYLVEFDAQDPQVPVESQPEVEIIVLGGVSDRAELTDGGLEVADRWRVSIADLISAWRGTLDW